MTTILIADDEFDLAWTLRAILEGEGYRVETFANGKEVLDRLGAGKPALVLLDVMMPVVGGMEVLRTMKSTPGLDGIPIVLMSAVRPQASKQQCAWDVFLRKPFTIEGLLQTVGGLIGAPQRKRETV